MHRALVTGAAKRIGREIALSLAEKGFDVAVHYAGSEADAHEVASHIQKMGRHAATLQADLTQENEMQALMPRAIEALGGEIDLLVNNASIFEHDRIGKMSRDSWDRHLESNLRAPVVLSEHFAKQAPEPELDAAGEPKAQALIINMLDQRVRKLTPEFTSYAVAKMGLWAFTQIAARALAPKIRVNGIGPGPTLIGMEQSEEGYAKQRHSTILQRGSNPEDITAALHYFINAPAITGQLLCVDGGQHLAWETPDVTDIG